MCTNTHTHTHIPSDGLSTTSGVNLIFRSRRSTLNLLRLFSSLSEALSPLKSPHPLGVILFSIEEIFLVLLLLLNRKFGPLYTRTLGLSIVPHHPSLLHLKPRSSVSRLKTESMTYWNSFQWVERHSCVGIHLLPMCTTFYRTHVSGLPLDLDDLRTTGTETQ